MVSNGLIRAYGNPTFPGYIMTIAPVIQVLVGPVLIFGWFDIAPMGLNGPWLEIKSQPLPPSNIDWAAR